VRKRAAEEVENTACAAAKFGVKTVNGFTGSKIWHTFALFPPVPPEMIEDGKYIFHMHVKESERNLNGSNGILSSHLFFGDRRRGWDFVSPGRGGVPWERVFRALNDVGYKGPLSIEWEDNGMNRDQVAPEALALSRRLDLTPSDVAFDDAFKQK
jgi:sugar phosphate isomerase/epimerase